MVGDLRARVSLIFTFGLGLRTYLSLDQAGQFPFNYWNYQHYFLPYPKGRVKKMGGGGVSEAWFSIFWVGDPSHLWSWSGFIARRWFLVFYFFSTKVRAWGISREPRNKFLNCFFLLKTEIHLKILNTEPILCDIRALRYLQTKMGLGNRHNHIGNDLKWS